MEWLQLLVPIPAFGILLLSLVPFVLLQPFVDPTPGGGMLMFVITFAAFLAAAAWAVWGPDRVTPDGDATAILDLRLTFLTRAAIHLFFLGALVVSGFALRLPVLLAVALLLLAAEIPLAWLTAARHRGAHAGGPTAARGAWRAPAVPTVDAAD
jgi:hypothetical protein